MCVRVREARGPHVGLTAAAPRPMQIKTGKGVSSSVDGITRLVTLMTPAALHACGPERHGSASQQGLEPKRYTPAAGPDPAEMMMKPLVLRRGRRPAGWGEHFRGSTHYGRGSLHARGARV